MKVAAALKHRKQFDVLLSSRSAQAAMMTLAPGASSSDEPEDEHPWSEQWLFVIRGTATARVGRQTRKLRAGDLLLIEKRMPHQIRNTGRRPLVTLNVYVPIAYRGDGELIRSRQKKGDR